MRRGWGPGRFEDGLWSDRPTVAKVLVFDPLFAGWPEGESRMRREPVMNEKTTTFVGLDAHKDQIVAAVLPSHDGEPVITKFGAGWTGGAPVHPAPATRWAFGRRLLGSWADWLCSQAPA